jgi:serine phosphatase RsbU (regulator of sigma subunit)
MLGSAFLNEIVNGQGVLKPSEILGELRNRVKSSLKQTGEVGASRDGMDMALVCFNEDNSQVEYAGANNPLWICTKKNGEVGMNHYVADKRPIGYFMGKSLPFTNHVIDLNKGDMLYVFSDGYADQFGGPKGKKFKYKQLETLLMDIFEKDPAEQKEILDKKFEEWRGNLEQVDDVCIIGIRI